MFWRCLLAVITVAFFSPYLISAQECVLKIGAWNAYPEESTPNGGKVTRRKGTVKGFSATVRNKQSRVLTKGTPLLGNVYFENIPEGSYEIEVRKTGFKTTIQTHNFSCADSDDEFDFVDILLFPGKSTEIVRRGIINSIPPRDPVKYTVRGDPAFALPQEIQDVDTNATSPPKQISGGVLNKKALSLPDPIYPRAGSAVRASGAVTVSVLVDENGSVIEASSVSGHPLLRNAAKEAAFLAKFAPVSINGQRVQVRGVITYVFKAP